MLRQWHLLYLYHPVIQPMAYKTIYIFVMSHVQLSLRRCRWQWNQSYWHSQSRDLLYNLRLKQRAVSLLPYSLCNSAGVLKMLGYTLPWKTQQLYRGTFFWEHFRARVPSVWWAEHALILKEKLKSQTPHDISMLHNNQQNDSLKLRNTVTHNNHAKII